MIIRSFLALSCCWLLSTVNATAQQNQPLGTAYASSYTYATAQHKNYFLLTMLQQDKAIRKLLQSDSELSKLFKDKTERISSSTKNCVDNITCLAAAFKFTESEIKTISKHLSLLLKPGSELDNLVKTQVITSGSYSLYTENSSIAEVLTKAWEQDAKAINHTISVYVEGAKPNYPNIDSIVFNVKDRSYPELVNTNALLSLAAKNSLFFEPSLQFAMVALENNERLDAADYEPLISTVNNGAVSAIQKINFKDYRYSLILVPGEGPEEHDTELSAGGMLRCRLAAVEYFKGAAPFIMVSGGRVHPYKTKYSEAYEMKKFLMQTLNIPESSIIMEPHARHTTTNMRNAARLMFKYKMPMEKTALVVTVKSQSMYISDVMLKRCVEELGYEPYRLGKRLSDTILEFYPNVMSLQIDFDEPMDP